MTVLYGSLQDHVDAVLALARAPESGLVVYPDEDGGVTTVPNGAAPPYVVLHFTADRPRGDTLDMRSTRMRMRIFGHCVGANDMAARAVADLLAGALLDVRPVIEGRTCYPIRSEGERPQPPRDDESTGLLFATITEVYRLESMPGPSGS